MAERLVRFSQPFFDRLDLLFPEERGADVAPSAADFLLYELPRVRDQLAREFEGNTVATDEGPVRVWLGAGMLVASIAVYAYLAEDAAVEVISLLVGWHPPTDEDIESDR